MAVTKSWSAPELVAIATPRATRRESWWLFAASIFVAAGIAMVFAAKTQDFAAVEQKLAQGALVQSERRPPGPEDLLRTTQIARRHRRERVRSHRAQSALAKHRRARADVLPARQIGSRS